jgi:peptidoglycan-associated lipoprotein
MGAYAHQLSGTPIPQILVHNDSQEKFMKQIALCILAAALAAGCASKDPKDASVTDMSTGGAAGRGSPPLDSAGRPIPQGDRATLSGSADELRTNAALAKRSVYFDYDSNAVKDEYRGLVQDHSRYMTMAKKDSRIRIEGNADERGSREYNLALGQRRAEAVKRVMTVLGVADGRIETISYGEEKPKATGHDEASWAENRRADIRYAGE